MENERQKIAARRATHLVAAFVGLETEAQEVVAVAFGCVGVGRVGKKTNFDIVATWNEIEIDVEVLCEAATHGAFVRQVALQSAAFHADRDVELHRWRGGRLLEQVGNRDVP